MRATAAELPDYTFDEAAIRPWIGRPFTAMLAKQGVTDHDQWMTVYRRHYRKAHNEMLRPIEGISGLLERLADAGVRIGVVSSKKTDYIDLGLDRLGVGSWVDVLVGADDTERHKPGPEPLLYAAGLLDAKPSRCVYVGDAVTDVVAGRAAGMATIAVTWGAQPSMILLKPVPRLSSAASPNWQNSCSSTHVELEHAGKGLVGLWPTQSH